MLTLAIASVLFISLGVLCEFAFLPDVIFSGRKGGDIYAHMVASSSRRLEPYTINHYYVYVIDLKNKTVK